MDIFVTIFPHAVSWLLYLFGMGFAIANLSYISRIKSKLRIKYYLLWASFLILTVTGLFLSIQTYLVANSVLGDESTTMVLLWAAFHYYNAFTYIAISVGIRAYVKWRTALGGDVMLRNRKEDWL